MMIMMILWTNKISSKLVSTTTTMLLTRTKHFPIFSLSNSTYFCATQHLISVTRFGEFSQLWHYVKKLWPFWNGSFSILQNFQITLVNFICYLTNFHCFKWPKIERTIEPSSHTVANRKATTVANHINNWWLQITTLEPCWLEICLTSKTLESCN